VWGLSGEVLTADFPKDHFHHHGVFWTWPHVGVGGKEYDLWLDRGIKQRFVRWLHRQIGPVAAVLAVENGWFVGDQKVMIERVWLRVYRVADDAQAVDLEILWVPVGPPVTLWGAGGKSYGGLTVRFADGKQKSVITVPEGVTEDDLKETRLPWADFSNHFEHAPGLSGAAIFVHPEHPDYPPTWLTRHYGPLCIGWPGVKPKTFPAGRPFGLSYRIWIHKTAASVGQIREAYEAYVAAMKISGG
jgi:hypothetical protein